MLSKYINGKRKKIVVTILVVTFALSTSFALVSSVKSTAIKDEVNNNSAWDDEIALAEEESNTKKFVDPTDPNEALKILTKAEADTDEAVVFNAKKALISNTFEAESALDEAVKAENKADHDLAKIKKLFDQ